MRVLGAILAGGASRRFGSDKALTPIGGRPMIERVAAAVGPQVDALVVCGRDHPGLVSVADRPGPELGPLGGLLAALLRAGDDGFDAVLAVPCDMPALPPDLRARLQPAPAFLAEHPVVGLWPASLAPLLSARLDAGDRAVRAFAEAAGARAIALSGLINVNRPADLDRLAVQAGVRAGSVSSPSSSPSQ